MSQEYYLIKKSDLDAIKKSASEKLQNNIHRPLSEDAIAADACLDVIAEIEKSNIIDLSDEAIEKGSYKVWVEVNETGRCNSPTSFKLGYKKALKDLIEPKQ